MDCAYCDRPLTHLWGSTLELLTTDGRHPAAGRAIVARCIHLDCLAGEGCGYYIDFPSLLGRGLYGSSPLGAGWSDHMGEKNWWNPALERALVEAHSHARRLHASASALASAARTKRPRAPRTPRNPRNIYPTLRAFVLERDDFRCRRCGSTASHARLVIDHVVPVAAGGTADPGNLQVLCEPCNAGKGARTPHPHEARR